MAALPNVVVKISGVVTEADHRTSTIDHVRPYVNHTIECFGFSRVLFGSDWPVLNLAGSFPGWVSLLDEILTRLLPFQAEEQAASRRLS